MDKQELSPPTSDTAAFDPESTGTVAPAPRSKKSASPFFPKTIGPYCILSLLGEGGMGSVFKAEQQNPHRLVALKVIKAGIVTDELFRRFEQEAEALGRLQHPGIAQVYEAGTADSGFGPQPYFAMEFIEGLPLVAYAAEQRLNVRARLELMAKVCDAVNHAHQRGIIHRDLKPGNILVDAAGQPKVLDFGVARITDSDAQATRQTDIGQLIGTLSYMSPEQALANPLELDLRSDVYTLGVILYQLLADKLPYNTVEAAIHEVIRVIREEDPAPLSSINRSYRGDIETIVAKALEKDRARRYETAADLASDIRRHLKDEPIAAQPASASYQLQKFVRRHTAIVTGVAVVFLALSAGVIASTIEALKARRAEASAQAVNDFLQNDLLAQASAFNQSGAKKAPDPDLKVRTALDRAAQNIQGKFDNQPQVEAAIRDTIGQTYNDLGLYPEARSHLQRALELRRRVLGPTNAKTLETESHLASVASGQGKFAESEALYSHALQTERRVLGSEHPSTLRSMSGLATLYYDNGKFAQSEALRSQILAIQQRVQGPEKQETLQAMSALGAALQGEGKYAQAEALQQQALEIKRRVLGPEDLGTLSTAFDLGTTYTEDGKFTQAEQLVEHVLDIYRRILGPRHPTTLSTLNILAGVYFRQGKYAQAGELYGQALEIDRQVLGPEHASTLKASVNLAMVNSAMGNYPQAEALYSQAMETSRRVRGREDFITSAAMSGLGEVYYFEGKYTQAEALEIQAIQTSRHVRGEEHRNTLLAMTNLAAFYTADAKYAQAEPLFQQTLEIAKRVLGPEDYNTLIILSSFGEMYQRQGNYSQAETYARQALAGRRHAIGLLHPSTLFSETSLALALLSQSKYAQAETIAREALESDKKVQPDDWQRYWAECLLGASLVGQKKYDEGEPLLREGYRGMKTREQTIAASDRFRFDLARRWLDHFPQSHGKQKPGRPVQSSALDSRIRRTLNARRIYS